jgi:predicted nucleic acid-binding protein
MGNILVDTSIWVNHLRRGSLQLADLLNKGSVACHPFVIGELACGNLKKRTEILNLLQSLPCTPTLSFDEYLHFIDYHHLYGVGIGFVDIHLLASALLSDAKLWTSDKQLKRAAEDIGIAHAKG